MSSLRSAAIAAACISSMRLSASQILPSSFENFNILRKSRSLGNLFIGFKLSGEILSKTHYKLPLVVKLYQPQETCVILHTTSVWVPKFTHISWLTALIHKPGYVRKFRHPNRCGV